MANTFHDFDTHQTEGGRILITTAYHRNDRTETLDWYQRFYHSKGFPPLGLKLQMFLVLHFCQSSRTLEAAFMEKSLWFRIAKDGLDVLCIPLQTSRVTILLRSPVTPPGWEPYPSDKSFVKKQVADDADIESIMGVLTKVLIGTIPSRKEEVPTLVPQPVMPVEFPEGTTQASSPVQVANIAAEIGETSLVAEQAGEFDPDTAEDAREKTMRAIAVRRGQPRFREQLLIAYGGRCAVTGYDVPDALEAGHIMPYKGADWNHVSNGLLLRADIHVLFDLGLIAIDPESLCVRIAEALNKTSYEDLKDRHITIPADSSAAPNRMALEKHLAQSQVL